MRCCNHFGDLMRTQHKCYAWSILCSKLILYSNNCPSDGFYLENPFCSWWACSVPREDFHFVSARCCLISIRFVARLLLLSGKVDWMCLPKKAHRKRWLEKVLEIIYQSAIMCPAPENGIGPLFHNCVVQCFERNYEFDTSPRCFANEGYLSRKRLKIAKFIVA